MSATKHGTSVTMPKLGESVTEGTIAGWLKRVGDRIERYDPMVEVITDKVNAEVPAPVSGTLVEIMSEEGDVVPVGGVICVIDTGDESAASTPQTPEPDEVSQTDDLQVETEPVVNTTPSSPQTANGAAAQNIDTAIQEARAARDETRLLQIRSSPLVRRRAAEHAIDLATVDGTGMGGRVTKADIEAAIERGPTPAAPTGERWEDFDQPARSVSRAPQVEVWPGDEVMEASPMRRQIAEHMVRSVSTAPHVTVWMEVDMSAVVEYREAHKAEFQEREGFGLTYVPLVLNVVVEALQAHREINAVWDNGRIIRRKAINVGIAVALDDGLIVPVLKNADERNIVGLARSIDNLVARTRAGTLSPDDVSGGTFTLNNPGTLGSISSTPLLVQPQAGILSMEAIVKRPVVIDDMIGIRSMMNLSMSVDHRLLDGLAATRFLSDVKHRLEHFQAH